MKNQIVQKKIRCAIYTRKSAAEGLEKEFNTLDAQREAGESYIQSQKHEGWVVVDKHYDDGGFSGGNMERPALRELFDDIENGRIDIVVVYKVDRLSRSLMDFAKIIELFEKHNVSFVSVTQHFNTKDSMGRLTLNILLSFAQFERELISERTRDKMSAARRKGKWVGGIPLLGYDIVPEGGAIEVNPSEAQTVRKIFSYYTENRSLLQTLSYLNENDIRTKQWKTRKGIIRGGNKFSLTTLNHLLKNMAYIGKINYGGKIYDAEFEAILSEDVFAEVQKIMAYNAVEKGPQVRNKYNALLAGKVYCANCKTAMVHTYTKKTGTKVYRYYICSNATKRGWKNCPHPSLSAPELESYIVSELERISGDAKLRDEVIDSFYEKANAELAETVKNENSVKRTLTEIRKKISSGTDSLELRKKESDISGTLSEIGIERQKLENRIRCGKDRLGQIFADFGLLWRNLNFKEQYDLVDSLIEKIVYDGTKGSIFIKFYDDGLNCFKEDLK